MAFARIVGTNGLVGRRALAGAIAGAACFAAAAAAVAGPVDVVNSIRAEGCSRRPVAQEPLAQNPLLDRAAAELSRNNELRRAIESVAYAVGTATSLHARGATSDAALRDVLAARFCTQLAAPELAEIGAFQRGGEVWIVLAGPLPAPAADEARVVAERVLALVNEARGEARRCGRSRLEATHPLAFSATLTQIAARHAADMVAQSTMTHRGSDGSVAAERVTRAGYRWRAVGENVAAGQPDAESVVAGWLESPGHCANLMGPQFTEMGVAFALAPDSNPPVYWAQVLAAPQ
jgi:uncharacterized protein YkwD